MQRKNPKGPKSGWRVGFTLHFHCSRVNFFGSSEKFHQRAGEIFKYRKCHSFDPGSIFVLDQILWKIDKMTKKLAWKKAKKRVSKSHKNAVRIVQKMMINSAKKCKKLTRDYLWSRGVNKVLNICRYVPIKVQKMQNYCKRLSDHDREKCPKNKEP